MIDKKKLDEAINGVLRDPLASINKGNKMADDNQKKVEDANQKIADARPGNVVGIISSQGSPSTYEDENHPDGKAIAQVDEDGPKQDERYPDDVESNEKSSEKAAEEAAENADAQVKQAEVEAKAVDSKDSK